MKKRTSVMRMMRVMGWALLLLPATVVAQSSRITALQNARQLVVSSGGRTVGSLIPSGESKMLYCHEGQLIVDRDTLVMSKASMRVQSMPRFAVDEDSTVFTGSYGMENGLLAFRRTLNVGRWNSLTVPFDLTASQLRDAFGDDCQLLQFYRAVSSPEPALEFATVDLNTDDVVVFAGYHYLLKPTREPDIAPGQQTSVVYGSAKVAGPVYAIANVTMASGQTMPKNIALRSDDNNVRLRLRGHYASYSLMANTTPRYVVNDQGYFVLLEESVEEKGFRSWVENASSTTTSSLRFYIDGIGEDLTEPTGIADAMSEGGRPQGTIYDMQGRRVTNDGSLKQGIYIIGGRKVIIK